MVLISGYDLPSDRINQWIQQAINSNVQILTLNFGDCNKYIVPQCVLIGNTSLKKLSLTGIKLSDHLPQNLFTNLEELNLFWCYGLKVIDISDPTKLKKLVVMARNLECVHIEALILIIELLLGGETIKTVDIRHCKNLRRITIYRAAIVKTCWLDEVMSYCTSLETLNLNACQSLDVAKISSTSLKSLKILYCYSLDAIELNCPNLSEFIYCGDIVDLLSNVSASASVSIHLSSRPYVRDLQSWNLKQVRLFSKLNAWCKVEVKTCREKNLIIPRELRESIDSPMSSVKKLEIIIIIDEKLEFNKELIDSLFSISLHPEFSKDETSYEDESSAAVDQLDPFSKTTGQNCVCVNVDDSALENPGAEGINGGILRHIYWQGAGIMSM
ncbi:hypothetical protein ACFE04_003687 [Oxalis oulophora]